MSNKNQKLVTRDRKVAFLGCVSDGTTVYHRMRHFTSMSKSSNPNEYSRKYIDESGEETDITGYSPSYDYAFDLYTNDPVQEELVKIADGELVGTDAVRTIIVVDFTKPNEDNNGYSAIKRDYAVVPDSDGDDENTYTYSGTFRSKSGKEEIVVISDDPQWQTCTIKPSASEPAVASAKAASKTSPDK